MNADQYHNIKVAMYRRNGCSVSHLDRNISELEFKIYQRAWLDGGELMLRVSNNGTVNFNL